MTAERINPSEQLDYIDPTLIPELMGELTRAEGWEKYKDSKEFILWRLPKIENLVWKTLYPKRDPDERPIRPRFPNALTLGEYNSSLQTLGVGFSNSLPVEITWDYNIHRIVSIRKSWMDRYGQNWVQYSSYHGAALLSSDPWVGLVDRKVLEAMDGFNLEEIEEDQHMRGNLIQLNHCQIKGKTLQILYHFDIHGSSNSIKYLAARVLGEKGKTLNERHNHYLFYDNQIEEIQVPGVGQFEFVAQMPIPRLLRNIFFPKNFWPRDRENPSRESYTEGEYLNFWEINPADK